jgi:cell division protease FtsH
LIKRETIEKSEFEQLLAGAGEFEVFGPDDQPSEQSPPEVPSGAADQGRESPRPLPRPGLAGGSVETRGHDQQRPGHA